MPPSEMTTRERFARMFAHEPADRVPIIDHPWGATIERWRAEGLPDGVGFEEYFGTDRVVGIGADCSARYPQEVVEETDDFRITTTSWGVTMKNWRHAASTPQYLGFTIVDRDSWNAAKERMTPSDDRVDWDRLREHYEEWRSKGWWIQGHPWFGFDATHSGMVGTERVLMAMVEDPEWIADMFNFCLDVSLAMLDRIWDVGYTFDSLFWCDDMGFKHNQFFSLRTYRDLLKPAHARAVEWAHAKGIPAHLHSCGDIRKFVPDLVDIGIDALNPLEVKAGMDPYELKTTYGNRLVLHGGLNALLYDDQEATEAEIRRLIPAMKQRGGYIFSSDHSVPSSVSLEGFGRIVSLAKDLGRYE